MYFQNGPFILDCVFYHLREPYDNDSRVVKTHYDDFISASTQQGLRSLHSNLVKQLPHGSVGKNRCKLCNQRTGKFTRRSSLMVLIGGHQKLQHVQELIQELDLIGGKAPSIQAEESGVEGVPQGDQHQDAPPQPGRLWRSRVFANKRLEMVRLMRVLRCCTNKPFKLDKHSLKPRLFVDANSVSGESMRKRYGKRRGVHVEGGTKYLSKTTRTLAQMPLFFFFCESFGLVAMVVASREARKCSVHHDAHCRGYPSGIGIW